MCEQVPIFSRSDSRFCNTIVVISAQTVTTKHASVIISTQWHRYHKYASRGAWFESHTIHRLCLPISFIVFRRSHQFVGGIIPRLCDDDSFGIFPKSSLIFFASVCLFNVAFIKSIIYSNFAMLSSIFFWSDSIFAWRSFISASI
jgi:hypothetical protein